MIDSDFDWSTGAYEQVFTAHPEWVGKVIADLNFELPALAHGAGARIRSCYEYQPFLEQIPITNKQLVRIFVSLRHRQADMRYAQHFKLLAELFRRFFSRIVSISSRFRWVAVSMIMYWLLA